MIGVLSFTSCNNDNGSSSNSCTTCTFELLGTTVSSEYCDNGDGTMTVTTDGQEETVSLDGASYDSFITTLEQSGLCN